MEAIQEHEVRVVSPTSVCGAGFSEASFERALRLKPHFVGCDGGSTDPGPDDLGTGTSVFTRCHQARSADQAQGRPAERDTLWNGIPSDEQRADRRRGAPSPDRRRHRPGDRGAPGQVNELLSEHQLADTGRVAHTGPRRELGFNRNPVGNLGITSNAVSEFAVFRFWKIPDNFVEPPLNIWRRFYPLDLIAEHEFAIVMHLVYLVLRLFLSTSS